MINKRKEGQRKKIMLGQVYIFEDQKTFRKNGIKSVSIETLKGNLFGESETTVWIPPPGITNQFNKKILDILKKDFSFNISTSIFTPICDNLLIFGSESTGINIPVAKYIIQDLDATAVYIPQTRSDNGRKGKNSNASFNLVHSILMSLMILRSPIPRRDLLSSKKEISFWFPHWSPSGIRKGNEITTRMIGAMARDIVLSLGEKKIYWDYRSGPGEKGGQNNVAITVSQGLLKKEMLDITFPSFDSQDVLLIDIVIHPSDSSMKWDKFPYIDLGKKKILISVTDAESRGLYQPPNSIRLDYGGSPSTAMTWFLGLL